MLPVFSVATLALDVELGRTLDSSVGPFRDAAVTSSPLLNGCSLGISFQFPLLLVSNLRVAPLGGSNVVGVAGPTPEVSEFSMGPSPSIVL